MSELESRKETQNLFPDKTTDPELRAKEILTENFARFLI